jgi:pimeloyl-ACP methyl ester carboxylesterase
MMGGPPAALEGIREEPNPTSRRWPRVAAYSAAFSAAGLALLVPTSTAGASWYLANQLLDATGEHPYPVKVVSRDGERVALSRTKDLARPIPLGLVWPGGHAELGRILASDRRLIVRQIVAVNRGRLRPGLRAYTTGQLYDGDPKNAHGLAYTDVLVPAKLGEFPAWLVPPTAPASGTWVVAIHGRRGGRGDALRVLPTLAGAGLTTLVVTYRNDRDAPRSPDGCYHLGGTEWQDVAATVRYALDHGARDVILYGWSMGGSIALNLLRQAREADAVRALVLDCPVVDWVATLHMHAQHLNVPRMWIWGTLQLVQHRLKAQLAVLDHRTYAPDLSVPTLLFADHDDDTAAVAPILEFAALRPDLITVVTTEGAGHCRSWNSAPDRYQRALTDFLTRLDA